jgi:hypothetical protein
VQILPDSAKWRMPCLLKASYKEGKFRLSQNRNFFVLMMQQIRTIS